MDYTEEIAKEHLSKRLSFMIVTSSDLHGIIPRYEKSGRPSLPFYNDLQRNGLFHVIDGPSLIPILQKAYRKLHILPSNFTLAFEQNFIHMGDVYIGVLDGNQLRKLYEQFGDALFLENIREFLGSVGNRDSLTDVNREMLETLEKEPQRFLAKNNGITFRAGSVSEIDSRTICLKEASIVNGCQTTMSIMQHPGDNCYVLVKVVGSEHSWEIAKAANFQNKIDRIDLDLAEYIRPRDIRAAASRAGIGFKYQMEFDDSAFAILEVIYQNQISYQEIRSLFIGLFSRNPNNTIDPDYSQLRIDIIERLYAADPKGEKTFNILFKVQALIHEAAQKTQATFRGKEYASAFQRFWKDAKPNYRAFLAILTICGCLRQNIYDKNYGLDYSKMMAFIKSLEKMVNEHSETFVRYYRLAFRTVASQIIKDETDRAITLKKLYQQMHRAKFSQLYLQICINADDDDYLRDNQES